jgi:hypothetical protein
MKCIKKICAYFFIGTTVLLSNSVSLYAMESLVVTEKNQEHTEQDWQYGKRKKMDFHYIRDRNDQLYPYFPGDNDRNVKIPLLSDQVIARDYENIFGESYDVSSLDSKHKKTLAFVLQTIKDGQPLRIEGRDKKFAQKISNHILDLPLPIRQKIAQSCGNTMMCNTEYKQSEWDALLDDEYNKKECMYRVKDVGTGCCCLLEAYLKVSGGNAVPLLENIYCCLFVEALCCRCFLHSIMTRWLSETPEEKDRRQGFEAISLLEMKSEIVNDSTTKEKVD